MGGLQSTNWRQVRAYKRPRPVEDPHVHERPHSMKTGLFRGPNCFHGFSRGDDVEIIAGPTPVPGGDAVQPAEVTHFARIIDPSYCTNPGLVNLLVVQWYHRLHDMVENISPESSSDEVELKNHRPRNSDRSKDSNREQTGNTCEIFLHTKHPII